MKDDKKKKAAVETKNVKEPMSKNKNNKPKPTCSGDSCNKNKNNKEKFTQKLRPANINGDDNTDDIEDNATVDYASTLESAYDNLDKLLSSDAINNMSKDSQRLAEKQHALMGNIDKLHPMMEKAGSLLEGLNMGDMNNMLGNLQGKLDKLGGGEKPNKKED